MKKSLEPHPLIVAITGPVKTQAELATQLAERLLRRGFRVRALRTSRERIFVGGDVVLIPCRVEEVEHLAKRLEQEWTENWLTWYATHRQTRQRKKE